MFRCSLLLLFIVCYIHLTQCCPFLCTCRNERLDCSRRGLSSFPSNIPSNIHIIDVSSNNIEYFNTSTIHKDVISVNLSDNRIRKIDGNFKSFNRLTYLNIRKNQLTQIPLTHSSLEKLDISSNLIANLTDESIRTISSIRFVDLSRNKLFSIPVVSQIEESVLEKLDLTANLIQDLNDFTFQAFPELTSLRLYRNKIQKLEKSTFSGLDKLKTLDLARNQLRSIPALTFRLRSLIDLHLSKNRIHNLEDGSFHGCGSLQSLNISHNRLTSVSEGWLLGLEQLETLDLSINHIPSFNSNIWSHSPNLKFLSLENNMLRSLPSGAFRLLPRLEHLFLAANIIHTLHKTSLTGLDSLETLDISGNSLIICAEDETIIYNTSMPYLRYLKIASNRLKVVPSRAFARFPALEELDLTDNPIATLHPGAFEPLRLKKLKLTTSILLCDCHMSWFPQWFSSSGLDRSDVQLICSYPKTFNGINVLFIDVANLTCDDSPRARILHHPPSVVQLTVGDTARFTCNGTGYPPIFVEWRIFENGKSRTLDEDATTSILENRRVDMHSMEHVIVESTLELNDITLQDRAEYQCAISNQYAKAFSKKFLLEVNQAPIFLHEPDDSSALVGQSAKIICAATGVPLPQLRWSKDGDQTFPAARELRLHVRQNDDHLYFLNVTLADTGVYTCLANNSAGIAQASATLRIYQNKFHQPLLDRVQEEGDTLLLDCTANISTSHQRIEWKKNDVTIEQLTTKIQMKSDQQILIITDLQHTDGGNYSCELWAGTHFLDRQSTEIKVLRKGSSKRRKDKRNRRWLSDGLLASFFFGIAIGLILFMLFYSNRRQRHRRFKYEVEKELFDQYIKVSQIIS